MSDNSHSMDELLVKTVGIIETLPDRIEKLEGIVRELEKDFAAHQAKGESVLDKVSTVDGFTTKLEELKTEIDELKKQVAPVVKEHEDKEEKRNDPEDEEALLIEAVSQAEDQTGEDQRDGGQDDAFPVTVRSNPQLHETQIPPLQPIGDPFGCPSSAPGKSRLEDIDFNTQQ